MRRLHHEALEQLELLRTALDAAENAGGAARDTLEDMAVDHWNDYLDILHLITLHDDLMAAILGKHGMTVRDSDSPGPKTQPCGSRQLLPALLSALSRRHRRFYEVYGWRASPMNDYLKTSMTAEREHMAALIALIQDTI